MAYLCADTCIETSGVGREVCKDVPLKRIAKNWCKGAMGVCGFGTLPSVTVFRLETISHGEKIKKTPTRGEKGASEAAHYSACHTD